MGERALLEKKAWELVFKMPEDKKEILMKGFEEDNNKWEEFLNKVKKGNFIFYKYGKKSY